MAFYGQFQILEILGQILALPKFNQKIWKFEKLGF